MNNNSNDATDNPINNGNNNDKQIDDIVSMIDQFMSQNGGHMNISVTSKDKAKLTKNIQTTNSLECNLADMPCNVPTLHEGLDAEE